MKEFWNNRYKSKEYAYGTEPNEFFKYALDKYKIKGSILLPADGEGRNGVYAAQQGLQVSSFDLSTEGQRKALALASQNGVRIDYKIARFESMSYQPDSFDVIGVFYCHLPLKQRRVFYKKLTTYLKPNGFFILEEYNKANVNHKKRNPKIGGPGDLEMLNSAKEIQELLPMLTTLHIEEKERQMNEGAFHVGTGAVVQYIGVKE